LNQRHDIKKTVTQFIIIIIIIITIIIIIIINFH